MADIKVAFTEKHGMAMELAASPPDGVQLSFLEPAGVRNRFIRSQIKGYFRHYQAADDVLIEAVLSPIFTSNRWIYSLANFHEAMTFDFLDLPLPRAVRFAYIKRLLMKENFKKLVFWSEAGRETIKEYCSGKDLQMLEKCAVVYPSIRRVPDDLLAGKRGDGAVRLLFSGDFFRKGGVNVVDAFEQAARKYPNVELTVCCDERIDFNTPNASLKREYLRKLRGNGKIVWRGRISRDELLNEVLPKTDIYLLPTYVEAFGFAILEAMAYGIPVISTNHFAIPEMIEHEVSGYLIDTRRFNCEQVFAGYVVNGIPAAFRDFVTERLHEYLCALIGSAELRARLGQAALETARRKFSFEQRNARMAGIYREAMG